MDRNNDDVATLEKFVLKPTSKLKSAATHDNGYGSGRYGQYELIGNTMEFNGGRLRTMTAYLVSVEGDDEALVVEGCLYLKQPTVR